MNLVRTRLSLLVVTVLVLFVACKPKTRAPASSSPALRLESTVTGAGAPLALLGGGLTGIVGFEAHAEELSKAHTVVRLQQLSVQYGLEDRPLPPGYSIRMESTAMVAALDVLGYTGAIDVFGHSSGALIALDFALEHPSRVRSLVLSEPPAYFLLDPDQRAKPDVVSWRAMLEKLPKAGEVTEADIDAFLHGVGALPAGKSARQQPNWNTWWTYRRSLRAVGAVVEHTDDPERLRTLAFPSSSSAGKAPRPCTP